MNPDASMFARRFQRIEELLNPAIESFNKINEKYKNFTHVKQTSYQEVLKKLSTPEFFEQGQFRF